MPLLRLRPYLLPALVAAALLLPVLPSSADEPPVAPPAEEPAPPPAEQAPADRPGADLPPLATDEARPPLVTDEEAAVALEAFHEAFKATGRKGEEKLAFQDHAIRTLAPVQHARVVEALAKLTRHRSEEVRTSAVLQLGNQRALPCVAGEAVVAAVKKNANDPTFLMAGIESIGALGFLGAGDLLRELATHHDYAVVKNALTAMGELQDSRFIEDVIKLMKQLKLESGASWDGVSVTYDTGTAGTHDQEMAEKIGKEQEAKNGRRGASAARSMRDLGPIVLQVAKQLTGQEFTGSIAARKWVDENAPLVKTLHARDEQREKDQR